MAVTLLAMPRSGEIVIARDSDGRVWLIQSEDRGGLQRIDQDVADRAIARHDLERLDKEFPTWSALEDFRQDRVHKLMPAMAIDREGLGLHEVRVLLATAGRWAAEGEVRRARSLAVKLLGVPAVRDNMAATNELVSFLGDLQDPGPVLLSEPISERQRLARERLHQPAAA